MVVRTAASGCGLIYCKFCELTCLLSLQICSLLLAELLILHFPPVYHTAIAATDNQNTQSVDTPIEEAILTLSLAKTGVTASEKHDVLLDHLMTLVLIEANLPATLAEVNT